MKKNITTLLLVCTAALSFALNGCGSVDTAKAPTGATSVSGIVSLGTASNSTVSLKDSSVPAKEMTTTAGSYGQYYVNVVGLTPPYLLKATSTDTSGSSQMYSVSAKGGRTNINELSGTVVTAAAEGASPEELYEKSEPERNRRISDRLEAVINSLRTVLAPLFALYQTSGDPISDDDDDENSGLQAMLRDVRFVVKAGTVTVTNRLNGGLIYSAPLSAIESGTFYPENMPVGPGTTPTPTPCSYTYSPWSACQSDNSQTRTMLTSSPDGCIGTPFLSQPCIFVPPVTTCTSFTYSAWGACQSNNTQTRTQLTASPAGCTGGTPVLSQACTYVPPVTTCTSFTYSAWGTCQSNNTQTRTQLTASPAGCTGGTPVLSQACTYVPPVTTCTSFTYSAWGTCQSNNTQTRTQLTASPAGCTGGTPVLSQACTYVPPVTTCTSFTYSAWGACQSNNTQTRTQLTASPAGCTGGTPVLSQACTYVPPVTTCTSFTYSAWGACQSNNTQTRTQLTASPAGCTGGTPVLSQACTYVPPTPACGSCHSIPPSTGKHTYHVSSRGVSCSTCHGTGYSSTTVNAATHLNGTTNLVSSLNFNATTSSCSPACHGTKTW